MLGAKDVGNLVWKGAPRYGFSFDLEDIDVAAKHVEGILGKDSASGRIPEDRGVLSSPSHGVLGLMMYMANRPQAPPGEAGYDKTDKAHLPYHEVLDHFCGYVDRSQLARGWGMAQPAPPASRWGDRLQMISGCDGCDVDGWVAHTPDPPEKTCAQRRLQVRWYPNHPTRHDLTLSGYSLRTPWLRPRSVETQTSTPGPSAAPLTRWGGYEEDSPGIRRCWNVTVACPGPEERGSPWTPS